MIIERAESVSHSQIRRGHDLRVSHLSSVPLDAADTLHISSVCVCGVILTSFSRGRRVVVVVVVVVDHLQFNFTLNIAACMPLKSAPFKLKTGPDLKRWRQAVNKCSNTENRINLKLIQVRFLTLTHMSLSK